jgi:hypothetical protein
MLHSGPAYVPLVGRATSPNSLVIIICQSHLKPSGLVPEVINPQSLYATVPAPLYVGYGVRSYKKFRAQAQCCVSASARTLLVCGVWLTSCHIGTGRVVAALDPSQVTISATRGAIPT